MDRADTLTLKVNGEVHRLRPDPRTTVLDALREQIRLTGTKKGCDHGQCGACTVHLDGERVLSCLLLVEGLNGREVTTIESLAGPDGELHPMQQAFIDHDAFQCGYCTPGQIMSAIACVNEGHAGTRMEIQEFMSGNLCRCAAYPNIIAAIEEVRSGMTGRPLELTRSSACEWNSPRFVISGIVLLVMAPLSQELEPPANSGRFIRTWRAASHRSLQSPFSSVHIRDAIA